MKILRLRSHNINSLKGENEIDFVSFLGNNSLFAITGETGAGKTTLLDVITCALYGRTARLANGTEIQELMSWGAGEAICEVEFEVKGKEYRSKWTLRRARGKADGKFQPVKMELVSLPDEKIIESKAREVPKKIEEITGLDFDRFTQSMMLAQGSFDAFLKAEEKERSRLLEKITGTKIYSQISQQVYEHTKEGREEIAILEAGLNAIGCLSDEERKALEEDLTLKKKEGEQHKNLLDRIREDHALKQRFVTLQEELIKYTEAETKAHEEKQRNTARFEQLERANRALSIHALYTRKEETQRAQKAQYEAIARLEQGITKLKERIQTLETQKAASETAYNQGKKKFDRQSRQIEDAKALQQHIETLRNQIDEKERSRKEKEKEVAVAQTRLTELTQQESLLEKEIEGYETYRKVHAENASLTADIEIIATLIEGYGNDHTEMQTLKKRIKENESKQTALEAKLSTAQKRIEALKEESEKAEKAYNDADTQLQQIEGKEQSLIETQRKLETALERLEAYRDDKRLLDAESKNLKKHEASTASHLAQKKTLEGNVESIKAHLESLQKIKEQEILIQKYEEDRKRLQAGEPCYLCGSTEHPFIEHGTTATGSDTDTEKKIVSLQEQLTELSSQLNDTQRALGETEGQVQTVKLEMDKLKTRIQAHADYFNAEGISISEESEADIKERIETITSELSRLRALRTLRDALLKEKDEANRAYHSEAENIQKRQEEKTTLDSDLKHDRNQQDKYLQSLEASETKLRTYWTRYGLMFEASSLAGNFEQLQSRKAAYEQNEKALAKSENTQQELSLEIGKIESTHVGTKRARDEIEAEKKALYTQLDKTLKERKEVLESEDIEAYAKTVKMQWEAIQSEHNKIVGDYNITTVSLHDSEERLKGDRAAYLEKEEEAQTHAQAFSIALKDKGFENETVFKAALLPEDKHTTLQVDIDSLNAALAEAKTRREDTDRKIAELKDKEIPNKALEVLEAEKKEHEEYYGKLHEEIGTLKNRLDEDTRKQAHQKQARETLSLQRAEQAIWEKLNDLIGAADGTKFAKFAQGITLDNLIILANRHLTFLSDRYAIVRLKEEGRQLEIAVIDKYQGNEVRPANTLSGGESFLVSLSLALGLSELASQKITIDSLFLDEGFGTLDGNTLDVALNALNMLESRGKMIGVISHVETMKERIPLQIRIHKSGGGESHVELTGQEA